MPLLTKGTPFNWSNSRAKVSLIAFRSRILSAEKRGAFPCTHSRGNHRRMFHSFTPFTPMGHEPCLQRNLNGYVTGFSQAWPANCSEAGANQQWRARVKDGIFICEAQTPAAQHSLTIGAQDNMLGAVRTLHRSCELGTCWPQSLAGFIQTRGPANPHLKRVPNFSDDDDDDDDDRAMWYNRAGARSLALQAKRRESELQAFRIARS